MRKIRFIIGLIATLGGALLVANLIIWVLPIRGIGLTAIIAPVSAACCLAGLYLTGKWAIKDSSCG